MKKHINIIIIFLLLTLTSYSQTHFNVKELKLNYTEKTHKLYGFSDIDISNPCIFVNFNDSISLYCVEPKIGSAFLYKHCKCKLRLVGEMLEEDRIDIIPDDYKEYKGEQK